MGRESRELYRKPTQDNHYVRPVRSPHPCGVVKTPNGWGYVQLLTQLYGEGKKE